MGAYESLREQVRRSPRSAGCPRGRKTGNLVQSPARSPCARSAGAKCKLARTVEFAGMVEHVEFFHRKPAKTGEDGALRPDLVVHLPGGKSIIVRCQSPLDAYLRALEEPDAERQESRPRSTRPADSPSTFRKLSAKEYWKQFQPTPEMVVALFCPARFFFSGRAATRSCPHPKQEPRRTCFLPHPPHSSLCSARFASVGGRNALPKRPSPSPG